MAIMTFTSAYNFVPLNEYVYIPHWWDKVSHDIPFEDGEDGIIDVTIKTHSPLFIRDGVNSKYSAHVVKEDGSELYYIPGSSIKGMLRSVLEIMSFGEMDKFDDDYFGYRTFNSGIGQYENYQKLMNEVKGGWLRFDKGCYYLKPCDGEIEKISHTEIRKIKSSFEPVGDAEKKFESLYGKNPTNPFRVFKENKILVCTGNMKGKFNEYLFPNQWQEEFQLDKETVEKFLTIHKVTPLFKEDSKKGDKFYRKHHCCPLKMWTVNKS